MNKRVVILKHAFEIESYRLCLYPGASFKESCGDDLIFAGHLFRDAIYWAWLRWHLEPRIGPIADGITECVKRSVKGLRGRKCDPEERGFHDWMMMNAAVLSGSTDTIRLAAENVRMASPRLKSYQYDSAAAGLLASRVLGDAKREQNQLALFEKYKPNRVDPWPSRSLARAFVRRDYKTVVRDIEKADELDWSDDYLNRGNRRRTGAPVIVEEHRNQVRLNLRHKCSAEKWPYLQATFAKLAMLDGAPPPHDSFWLPSEFLKAMKTNGDAKKTGTKSR